MEQNRGENRTVKADLDDTVFSKFPDLRKQFSEEAEAVPERERLKVDFFWVAETSSETITQYDTQGNEQSYSKVREAAESEDLEAFYVVPIESDLCDAVGVESLKGESFDYFRRGRMRMSMGQLHSTDDRVHAINVNGTFLVIGPSGKPFITENENFHPRDFI